MDVYSWIAVGLVGIPLLLIFVGSLMGTAYLGGQDEEN